MSGADVIIIGGGPSGALTAMLLARAGVDVLVIDRSTFPRAKACGDCLSAEATALLQRNDLLHDVLALPHAEIRGWRIYSPSGHFFQAEFSDVAYNSAVLGAIAVERAVLDDVILQRARDAGARVLENTRVQDLVCDGDVVTGVVIRDGDTNALQRLDARHVIGSDGLRSMTARRMGAISAPPHARKMSFTLHANATLDFDDFGEMHAGDGICMGVAAVNAGRDRWNITLVADAARFGRDAATNATEFFVRSAATLRGLRNRIAPAVIRASMNGALASGPFDAPTDRIAFAGASLVGDAAGYFDPFTGQGVYHGMRCAELLAAAILDRTRSSGVLERGLTLSDYQAAARNVTRAPRRLQRVIDLVLSHPALADRAIERIARAPDVARAIIDVTGDVAPVRSLLRPSIGRSLLFPRGTRRTTTRTATGHAP
jgi:flavin-dependent dehydrogenase